MTDRTTTNGEVSLLARLRRVWETIDPAPDDLADRALFSLELEDLDTDFELLRLTERGDALAGARAGAASASRVTHITFASANVSVMLAVGPAGSGPQDGQHDGRRIDGWIAPAAAARVVAHTDTGECDTTADEHGRFVLTDVPAGMLRLIVFSRQTGFGGAGESPVPFVTPTMEV